MANETSNTLNHKTAYFALGCFWQPDEFFSRLTGVVSTEVGYCGGSKENPTYHDLDGHSETVKVIFDSEQLTYHELLHAFWDQHDPTEHHKSQYASKIFYVNELQHEEAEASWLEQQQVHSKPLVTEIVKFDKFWPAEDYHQKYLAKQRADEA